MYRNGEMMEYGTRGKMLCNNFVLQDIFSEFFSWFCEVWRIIYKGSYVDDKT